MDFLANKIMGLNVIRAMGICALLQMVYHWLNQPIAYLLIKYHVIKIMDYFVITLELIHGAMFLTYQAAVLL